MAKVCILKIFCIEKLKKKQDIFIDDFMFNKH